MPSVNPASLRAEFEVCRAKFPQLCEQGRVSPEFEVLFDGLLMLMRLMLTVFLGKTTRKGTKNSSLPGSRTSPDETAAGKSGARSKGPDPKIHDNAHTRKVAETRVSAVTACSGCGRDMARVECSGHGKRTRMDIVFDRRREHVESEIKTYPDCLPHRDPGKLARRHARPSAVRTRHHRLRNTPVVRQTPLRVLPRPSTPSPPQVSPEEGCAVEYLTATYRSSTADSRL